jgi:hypothetical protein
MLTFPKSLALSEKLAVKVTTSPLLEYSLMVLK